MGFSLYYRSTRPVEPGEADAVRRAVDEASEGRTWLSCEPPHFFGELDEGRLWGGSKPNFLPHPDDAASALREGLPDGDLHDLVDVLCRVSRDHGIDWEFRHDEADWSIGGIRGGKADDELVEQVDMLDSLADALGEMEDFGEGDPD